jgi:Holliday junction resolvasome RuvABC DNA-binding subunit
VGKKTATRLLVELKSVLKMPFEGISIETDNSGIGRSAILEVQEALGGLGYLPEEVRSVLGDLAGDDTSILLREALQKLATA